MSKVSRAFSVSSGRWSGEDFAVDGGFGYDSDVLEDVSFGEDVSAFTDLEGVAGVVVPVVVYSVEDSVALNLGATARSVVDIIALQGNHIITPREIQRPVMSGVACSTVIRITVDLRIGDGNTI